MYDVITSKRFDRDYKLAIKRGYNLDLLEIVVDILSAGKQLDEKYYDHALTGQFKGFRECYITSDWLLIYKITNQELELLLSRTGTHSDLFK